MTGLLASLAALIGMDVAALRERLERRAVAYGLIGAFVLVAVIFLLVAANTALAGWVGPLVAPLILAAAALVLAVIVFLALWLVENAQRKREAEERRQAESTALLTSTALSVVPLLLRSARLRQVGIPAGAALLAAWLASRPGRDKSD